MYSESCRRTLATEPTLYLGPLDMPSSSSRRPPAYPDMAQPPAVSGSQRQHDLPVDEYTSLAAASCRHTDVLEWLRQLDPPCHWDESCCRAAARKAHFNTLKWLRQRGCPWDESVCATEAATSGHLDMLEWISPDGSGLPEDVCTAAAGAGRLEVLKWLKQQDEPCVWDESVCEAAAEPGHLDVLEWLRQQDEPCPWDERVCVAASKHGHLDVLKWLGQQKEPCPWDEHVCKASAEYGHLDIVKWIRQQNPPCPWHKQSRAAAKHFGHQEVLQWLIKQSCPDGGQGRGEGYIRQSQASKMTPLEKCSIQELPRQLVIFLGMRIAPPVTHDDEPLSHWASVLEKLLGTHVNPNIE